MTNTDFAGIKDTDLVPAALTGYRQWRTGLDGDLRSVSYDYTWDRTETATCREGEYSSQYRLFGDGKHSEVIPDDGCGCGIYGWYQPEHSYQRHSGDVLGIVKVSGLTLMGAYGFRTQKAQIVAVSKPKGLETAFRERRATSDELLERWVDGVSKKYPGIEIYDTPSELIYHHPPADVANLVGETPPAGSVFSHPSFIAAFYSIYSKNYAVIRWHWDDVLNNLEQLAQENPDHAVELKQFLVRLADQHQTDK